MWRVGAIAIGRTSRVLSAGSIPSHSADTQRPQASRSHNTRTSVYQAVHIGTGQGW